MSTTNYRSYESFGYKGELSDEQIARDWTLSTPDIEEIGRYKINARLYLALQLCCVRLYGRFVQRVDEVSLSVIIYINKQLGLPTGLRPIISNRKATLSLYHNNILSYLGFEKYDASKQPALEDWIRKKIAQGILPEFLFEESQEYLLKANILLPGASILHKLIATVGAQVHTSVFERIYNGLPPEVVLAIEDALLLPEGEQHTFFNQLKEYPAAASITTLKKYLSKYQRLQAMGLNATEAQLIDPTFQYYLYQLTSRYNAKDIKRFDQHKRYALMVCFLLETQKQLLDYLIALHDQYITDMMRGSKNTYEKQYRQRRNHHKSGLNHILSSIQVLLNLSDGKDLDSTLLWQEVDREELQNSYATVDTFTSFTNLGYGQYLIYRYPSLRKYFAQFINLPFCAATGSEALLNAIKILRQLDEGSLKSIPTDAPLSFVPKELYSFLKDENKKINRNAWEMSVAMALKSALRSGNIYIEQSKSHVSFWNLILSASNWQAQKEEAYQELEQPVQEQVIPLITDQFESHIKETSDLFEQSVFASIIDGKLKLKRDDKLAEDPQVASLQKIIDDSLPSIRIECLLMEVDQLTGFTQHFTPITAHQSKPDSFYKTLIAAIVSQATNLGVVAMSASMKDTSVDMIRHVLRYYIREETLIKASSHLVDLHHELPLSDVYGKGEVSSSDAQRFAIRASSLLASYYPRYFGYYQKAIGIYTHVSDQYTVYNTKVISCGPREALYVLDGLLENNTALPIKYHTTDTHGYTEVIFALCHLLGFYFMPRIRDLKDQQLYKLPGESLPHSFTPLLTKTVNTQIIEEQWDMMVRVASSLKQRTAPAHIIVQRLMSSAPSDRLTQAFVQLGRIIKTKYILRYITDPDLRRSVQRQLNKGEYRHKLPRRVFFADQGEFTSGAYMDIMNKASCLSLLSNAVLYWNTLKINTIIGDLRNRQEEISDETLSHISLLPYKHIIPNGTYFIEDYAHSPIT